MLLIGNYDKTLYVVFSHYELKWLMKDTDGENFVGVINVVIRDFLLDNRYIYISEYYN